MKEAEWRRKSVESSSRPRFRLVHRASVLGESLKLIDRRSARRKGGLSLEVGGGEMLL